jgi:hypothetical protein
MPDHELSQRLLFCQGHLILHKTLLLAAWIRETIVEQTLPTVTALDASLVTFGAGRGRL